MSSVTVVTSKKKKISFQVYRNMVFLKKVSALSFEEAVGILRKEIKANRSVDYYEIKNTEGRLVPIL